MESIASFFGRLPEGEAKWCEGVLAADGALYGPSRNQRMTLHQAPHTRLFAVCMGMWCT